MKAVWKFEIGDSYTLMPKGAEILHIGHQRERRYVWALADDCADTVGRVLVIRGTGDELPHDGVYVGTLMEDPWVWHVFDCGEESPR